MYKQRPKEFLNKQRKAPNQIKILTKKKEIERFQVTNRELRWSEQATILTFTLQHSKPTEKTQVSRLDPIKPNEQKPQGKIKFSKPRLNLRAN